MSKKIPTISGETGGKITPPELTPPTPPAPAAGKALKAAKKKKVHRGRSCLVVGLVAAIVLGVAGLGAGGYFGYQWLQKPHNLLIGEYSRNGEADLFEVPDYRLEQQVDTFLRDMPPSHSFVAAVRDGQLVEIYTNAVYIPESDWILTLFQEESDLIYETYNPQKDTTVEILQSDNQVVAYYFLDEMLFVFREKGSTGERCFVARPGEKANRVSNSDRCLVSINSPLLFLLDENDSEDGLTTSVSTYNYITAEEQEITEVPGRIQDIEIAAGGERLLFRSTAPPLIVDEEVALEDNQPVLEILQLDVASGSLTTAAETIYGFKDYGFSPDGKATYALALSDFGDLELTLNGGSTPLVTGGAIRMVFSDQGGFLGAAALQNNGRYAMHVIDLSSQKVTLLGEMEEGTFLVVPGSDDLLLQENTARGDMIFSLLPASSSQTQEIFFEDNVESGRFMQFPGQDTWYLLYRQNDKQTLNAYSSLTEAAPQRLLDGWQDIVLLGISTDGHWLAFSGIEDDNDPLSLYLLNLWEENTVTQVAEMAPLSRDVYFSPNGKNLFYSLVTGGNPDDLVVQRYQTAGGEDAVQLFKDAAILDVEWETSGQPKNLSRATHLDGESFCHNAELLSDGSQLNVITTRETSMVCYGFRVETAGYVTLDVDVSEVDGPSQLNLYDREGIEVGLSEHSDWDDDPHLTRWLEAGVYFAKVTGLSGGDQTLVLSLEMRETALPEPVDSLAPGESLTSSLEDMKPLLALIPRHAELLDAFGQAITLQSSQDAWTFLQAAAAGQRYRMILMDETQQVVYDRLVSDNLELPLYLHAGEPYYLLMLNLDGEAAGENPARNGVEVALERIKPEINGAIPLGFPQELKTSLPETQQVELPEEISAEFDLKTQVVDVYYYYGVLDNKAVVEVLADSLGSDMDPLLKIFDAEFNFLEDNYNSGEGNDSLQGYPVWGEQLYYIAVSSENQLDEGDSRDYTIRLNLEETTLAVGEDRAGLFYPAEGEYRYRFYASSEQQLRITVTFEEGTPILNLQDPDKNPITLSYMDVVDEHTVEVVQYVYTAGFYEIRISTTAEEHFAIPFTISLDPVVETVFP